MNTTKKIISFTLGLCLLLILACKKDKTSKTGTPELTTIEVTNILATTALTGGTISSNGGENIVASGVCWSKTNSNPTISDDTTKSTVASGSFTAMLKNLTPSATYYVRAYAINRIGTGYGNVITFNTGNGAPVASGLSISGDTKANALLTGNYTYIDAEGDAEGGTSFQWYTVDDASGSGETAIVGATAKTFKLTESQQGKYIRFSVTPKAVAGNQNGAAVKSAIVGAVGEANTVTFTYDGQEVTYGIIIGPSGKKWLDRNLGASRLAQSVTDYLAIGDMFQWGRLADGHQRVTRTDGTDAGATGVTGISTTRSDVDVPASNQFITTTSIAGDWRRPQNKDLWQGVNGVNNPCPLGWRIATEQEWANEGFNSIDDAFSKLKLTYTGYRDLVDGTFGSATLAGYYWTSSVRDDNTVYSIRARLDGSSSNLDINNRAYGYPCRCIKQN